MMRGDVVQLKSGGPLMTVKCEYQEDDRTVLQTMLGARPRWDSFGVRVVWIGQKGIERNGVFMPDLLVVVK